MKKNHLTLKIFALILINDIGDTVAQYFMKKGLVDTGTISVGFGNLMESAARSSGSAMLWIGIIIQTLNFFIWIAVLYRIDLSIAMPVGSASYIFVPVVAILFLHEQIAPLRWIGILCIILGIHFVSRSKSEAGEGLKP